MDKEQVILETSNWVKSKLEHEGTGHDWYHITRVTKQAKEIAIEEGANLFIVTLTALLHDLADDKVVNSEEEGRQEIKEWLHSHHLSETDIHHIITIIKTMSFKGGNNRAVESLEAQVVQDADRLDALGAIGIARTFIYSGSKGQPMYDPTISTRESMSVEEYRHGTSSAVHHFYEKLLKLKDLMNTESGKKRAEDRHSFMEEFLEQFYHEWE
ncbi:HD domain-containing protein [Bacillus solitudinis]|uniref:HD domain-containing protein n=1 Tax=Bacillus solitudinis TaxID=2014074 RepID=UPI000C2449B6|nr:HD domain-containing protein [Bacillus solitudinis]